MENHINTPTIKQFLNKICTNQSFSKSPRYTHLLTYLVEQSLEGNDLKEHTIGIELFEKKYNSDKNDGIVRVYMYNLRKKLKAYYLDNGKNDSFVFTLEKGSYNLKFIPKTIENNKKEEKIEPIIKTTPKFLYTLTAIAFFAVLAYFLTPHKKTYCWNPFLKKNATNICVIADQVVMFKKRSNIGELIIRKEVNSSSDYINYSQKNSSDSLLLSDYTFFTKAVPYSINHLSRYFSQQNQFFSLVPESEFRYDEVAKNNIIYIGQYKTMNVSKEIFLKNSKVFKANYNNFVYQLNDKETIYRANFTDGLRSEYVMVSYITLKNNNKAIYFVSNNDIGTMASINKFTDVEFLQEFNKKLPSSQIQFNALFKVEGVNRTDINCKLVQLEIIEE
jgi:hypothetical protein